MRITDEMIKQAQSVDLVDYLTSIGYTLQKAGNCYKLKLPQKFPGDLSSLSVFSDRKGWKRWSNDTSGHDAISFIQKVLGKTFQEAVCELCHDTPHITPEVAPSYSDYGADKQLQLPDPTDGKYSRAFAYLTQTRGIDPDIVSAMMKEKKMYQDGRGNVVFVGKDEKDQPKYAAFRSTVQGKQYRGECSGSDKRFGFRMDGSCAEKVYVFEAPIDAMSHASLVKQITGQADAWKVHTRLALGGTSDAALEQFLKDHPACRDVTLCLDNDEAGIKAAKLIAQKLSQQGYAVRILPPKAKDYNEQLIAYKAQVSARQGMRKQ